MKKTFLFYILCLITAVLFINSLFGVFNSKSAKSSLGIFSPVYNVLNVVVDTAPTNPDDIIIKVNGNYFDVPKSINVLNRTIRGKVDSIDILISKSFKDKTDGITIFNNLKTHFFKDLSLLENKDVILCPKGECREYRSYKIPKSVFYNYNGHIHSFCVLFLSLFSLGAAFFAPYIFLFISCFYYINNKEYIKKPKINGWLIFALIFAISIILRLDGLSSYLPWADEYWSIEFSNPNAPLLKLFSDPGNPPCFYILLRIWFSLFGISLVSMKTLPVLFGILTVIFLWAVLYKLFNLKTANIGLFIASVNIPLIYFSQETRSYIFQAMLTPVVVYFLIKIIKENNIKDYIIYGVLAAVLMNAHYYETLFIFSNFIYILCCFISQKRYKDILKFTISNVLSAITFLPYFVMTSYAQALSEPSFNSWIPDISYNQVKKCVYYLFGGGASLFLSALFFIKAQLKKEKTEYDRIMTYSFLIIVLVIAEAVLLSLFIRPMLIERYLVLLCPLFIIFLSLIFSNPKKYSLILFIIWVLLIQSNTFEKNNRAKGIIEVPVGFARQYGESHSNKNIYVILNTLLKSQKLLLEYNKLLGKHIIYISKTQSETFDEINSILKSDPNAVILTSMLENKKYKDNYKCFFNAASDMCLWKIESSSHN